MLVPSELLRAQVADLETALAQQKKQAEEQQRVIKDTEARLTELRRQLNILASPPGVVPPEILSIIFRLYHGEAAGARNPIQNSSSPYPLTRVCGAWRRTALSLSELWCCIELDLDTPKLPRQLGEILMTWFGRAGTRPLRLRITGYPGQQNPIDELQPLLARYSSRLTELVLDQTSEALIRSLDHWGLDFAVLEEITLSVAWGRDEIHSSFASIKNAPRLRSLELENVYIWKTWMPVPWKGLRTLSSMASTDVDECVVALKNLPLLEEMVVSLTPDTEAYWGKVRHTNLQRLTVFYEKTRDFNRLLASIVLPSLRKLELHGNASKPFSAQKMADFLERSAPPICELTLPSLPELDVLLLFTGRCSLVRLEISYPQATVMGEFFDTWLSDEDFCAQVTDLVFHTRPGATLDMFMKRTAEAVSQRQPRHLRRLEIDCNIADGQTFSEELLAPLRQLKADGLNLFVGSWNKRII
ncbi:hypothetical protein HMN09_00393500 [Mycena chlorophos]|uniref:F-box domain-containing protein n=1 Tax=Mycena chlorophos TaxID=658473 RepID=A0A8H6TD40_MYCCL|nr:hypothetical protein HMN09_00393500 [Mycena chlorophos]